MKILVFAAFAFTVAQAMPLENYNSESEVVRDGSNFAPQTLDITPDPNQQGPPVCVPGSGYYTFYPAYSTPVQAPVSYYTEDLRDTRGMNRKLVATGQTLSTTADLSGSKIEPGREKRVPLKIVAPPPTRGKKKHPLSRKLGATDEALSTTLDLSGSKIEPKREKRAACPKLVAKDETLSTTADLSGSETEPGREKRFSTRENSAPGHPYVRQVRSVPEDEGVEEVVAPPPAVGKGNETCFYWIPEGYRYPIKTSPAKDPSRGTRQVGYAGYRPDAGIYAVFLPNYNPLPLVHPSGVQGPAGTQLQFGTLNRGYPPAGSPGTIVVPPCEQQGQ